MKEFMKRFPVESWMGMAWIITAFIIYLSEGATIYYHITVVLGFMALFIGTVIVRIGQAKDEILEEIRKDKEVIK